MADLNTPMPSAGGIGGMFTRKYAGVPAFVILLVIAGAGYLYIKSRGSGSSAYSSDVTGADSGSGSISDLGSEAGYQASGQPQIVFIPSNTNPDSASHPAGPGGKRQAPKGWTGRGARGMGQGHHGKKPVKAPVRH